MPVRSLGKGYFEFLSHNTLEKNLAPNCKQLHDYLASSGQLDRMPESMKYAIIRGFQIHDILHVVTGYTPSGLHELSLQAFCLAQLQFPYFGMWMATSTARMTFLQPDSIVPVMDAITQGWQYGRATPNLQFVRWEDFFERQLSEIRVQFSIPESTVASLAA